MAGLIAQIAGDEATLRRQIKDTLKRMGKVDAWDIHQFMQTQPLSKAQAKYVEDWLGETQGRQEFLLDPENLDSIVNAIATKGGLK